MNGNIDSNIESLLDLIAEYWDIAYEQGKAGLQTDDEEGRANACLARIHKAIKVPVAAAVQAERARCVAICDDEAQLRRSAAETHGEDSPSYDRQMMGARAARNCAKGIREGEVVIAPEPARPPRAQVTIATCRTSGTGVCEHQLLGGRLCEGSRCTKYGDAP